MNDSDANLRDRLNATFDELARLAHKMNNPLTALLGRAQLLQLDGSGEDRVRHSAAVIAESAGRVAGHVRELANLVREARELMAESPHPAQEAAEPEGAPVA